MGGLDNDPIQLASFQPLAEFQTGVDILLRNELWSIPSRKEEIAERRVLEQLGDIVCTLTMNACHILTGPLQLDQYQEQSYLLDPHLETLLSPLILVFRNHVRAPSPCLSALRLNRLARLMYFFTKVRGAKTICMSSDSRVACSSS